MSAEPEQAYEGLVWMPARMVGAMCDGSQAVEFETSWGRTLRWLFSAPHVLPGCAAVAIEDEFKDRVRVRARLADGVVKRTWVQRW